MYPQGCDVANHLSLFLCVADYDKLLPGGGGRRLVGRAGCRQRALQAVAALCSGKEEQRRHELQHTGISCPCPLAPAWAVSR